jgi:5,10-methylenetetrahydrofolate reductase
MPRDVGGRSMYMASAEYMAEYARHLVQAGAKVVGGCCGTTPEHIRAMCEFVRPLSPRFAQPGGGVSSAIGLRNLLLITGDPPKMGPYPSATAVFDIDAIGLTNLVRNLNHGRDPGDNAIGKPTEFVIGVGVNPAPIDLEQELRRFAWKLDAGAEFAVTQPVFDSTQLENFLNRTEGQRPPIVAGIWPLVSVRNAEFLANEVPGVSVPASVIERMRRASEKSKEHAVAEGIAIAREMLDRVRGGVQGVQVSAPFGKVELALEVFGDSLDSDTTSRPHATNAALPV